MQEFKNIDNFRLTTFEINKYSKELAVSKTKLNLSFYSSLEDVLLHTTTGIFFKNTNDGLSIECLGNKFAKCQNGINFYTMLSGDIYIKAEFFLDKIGSFAIFEISEFQQEANATILHLKKVKDFFRFQRRELFRVAIPSNYEIRCLILQNNQTPLHVRRVLNVSLGGMLVEIHAEDLHKIGGSENLLNKNPYSSSINLFETHDFHYQIPIMIKHITPIEYSKENMYRIGIQFLDIPGGLTNILNSTILKLGTKKQ